MQETRAETSRANRRGRQRVLRQTRIRGSPRAVERQAPACALERIKEREFILLLCISLTYRAALLIQPHSPPLGPGTPVPEPTRMEGEPGPRQARLESTHQRLIYCSDWSSPALLAHPA